MKQQWIHITFPVLIVDIMRLLFAIVKGTTFNQFCYVRLLLFLAIPGKSLGDAEATKIIIPDTNDVSSKDTGTHGFTCINENGTEQKWIGKTANKLNKHDNGQLVNATSTERTWIAFMRIKNSIGASRNVSSMSAQTCGGVLISQQLLLTAAHCCCDLTHCKARQVTYVLRLK